MFVRNSFTRRAENLIGKRGVPPGVGFGLIALTRPIDTLVIQLSDPNGRFGRHVLEAVRRRRHSLHQLKHADGQSTPSTDKARHSLR